MREIADVFDGGQPRARGLTVPVDTAIGSVEATTNGYRVDGESWEPKSGVPLLGAHTHEVLSELGLERDEIEALTERGVVRQAEA